MTSNFHQHAAPTFYPTKRGHTACYLCSNEANTITGVCADVDGWRCI